MSGEGEGTKSTGSESKFDLKKFLEDNKLMKSYDKLKEREVDINELMELEEDDLNELCKEIGLDTISRKRFIKGIVDLKDGGSKKEETKTVDTKGLSQNEEKLAKKLIELQKKLVNLEKDLLSNKDTIENSYKKAQEEITSLFTNIEKEIESRKKTLSSQLDNVKQEKIKSVETQIKDNSEYVDKLSKSSKSFDENNEEMVKECKQLLKENVPITSLTTPDIKILSRVPFKDYLDKNVMVDSCDVPYPPIAKLSKFKKGEYIKFDMILNDKQPKYIQTPRKYEIAWGLALKLAKKDKEKKR